MTVHEFNTDLGLYIFDFGDIDTEFHSHPAIEIIEAKSGTFTIYLENAVHQSLQFAVIQANQKHKLLSNGAELTVTMIEHHRKLATAVLSGSSSNFDKGLYFSTSNVQPENTIRELVQKIKDTPIITDYDERILSAISYINNNYLEYDQMMKTLKGVTNLSESRLSHLFTTNLGISLKRYLVWTKLKSTIKEHLKQDDDLFSALIKSGFYDQPHFSRNFKAMLGVKASKAYNSRTLQVLPVVST